MPTMAKALLDNRGFFAGLKPGAPTTNSRFALFS